jgi:hypothetical protein
MNWAAVSWYTAGSIITLNGLIIVSDYMDILGYPNASYGPDVIS